MIEKSMLTNRRIIPFHTTDELYELRIQLYANLITAKHVPEFPTPDFKLNLGLIRDIELEIEHVTGVITARETISI